LLRLWKFQISLGEKKNANAITKLFRELNQSLLSPFCFSVVSVGLKKGKREFFVFQLSRLWSCFDCSQYERADYGYCDYDGDYDGNGYVQQGPPKWR
jgi:hypothetical protein